MEGLSSYEKLGFDSCQIQDNPGCAQFGSWGRVGNIRYTWIYWACIQIGRIFVSNVS